VDVNYVFAGIAVEDLGRSLEWYESLLGRPPDLRPNEAEAAWQLTAEASVYLVVEPHRAGGGVVTLIVDDLEGFLEGAAGRGLTTGPITEVGDAGRKAVATDPDGNAVAFAQLNPP
jgi:predicted enzyme related to lactoylglutathione lyase